MDLPIIIHKEALVPLHRQLTNALRDAISCGRLTSRQALPSTRELAETLSISRRTVVRSYNDLVSQGYLETKFGGSTFVSTSPPIDPPPQIDSVETEDSIDTDLLSDFTAELLKTGTESLDFGFFSRLNYCAAPAEMLPVKQWRALLSKQCAITDPSQLGYVVDVFGDSTLRDALAKYLRRSKALQCNAEQVISFSDTKGSLDLISRTLINAGDTVVVEDPGYVYAREMFMAYGANVVPIPIDENGLCVDELKKLTQHVKLLYCTPSHQDPTGAVMSLERRRALLAWAKDNCDFIVEDAFDSDYFFSTAPLPALHAMDDTGRVMYLYSFWKLLFPLTATGYLVVPPGLLPAFRATKQHVNRFFSSIEQLALAEFLNDGHLERHWKATRGELKKRRQALIFALKMAFLDDIAFFGEGAGLHLTVRFTVPKTSEQILECAENAGFPLMPTHIYYADAFPEREFLVPFSVVPSEDAAQLVERFVEQIKK
jgi:GntR family transcriptional regulator/MocR family aminotransferase